MNLDREQIVQVFASDSEDYLRNMEEALMQLESNPEDEETLQTIFRVAHTLKGDSATLGFTRLAEFAHAAEHVLDQLRKRKLQVTPALISTLLATTDLFRALVQSAVQGKEEIPSEFEELLHALQNPAAHAPAQVQRESEV